MDESKSEYTIPGIAVWGPRLRLTSLTEGVDEDSTLHAQFLVSDNVHSHPWAVPSDNPTFNLIAVLHPTVQLEEGKEYIAYFVPVDVLAEHVDEQEKQRSIGTSSTLTLPQARE